MCGPFIHKVSNMEITSTNPDDHDATDIQAPEIMRDVKTRKERNQSSLGYSTMWEKYSKTQLQNEQQSDPDIAKVFQWVDEKKRPEASEITMQSRALRYYWHIFDSLKIVDGLLVKEYHKRDNSGFHLQLVSPKKLRKEAMSLAHDNLLSGHLGRKKTQEKISRNFLWFEMKEDISTYIASCKVCQKNKKPYRSPRAELGQMTVGAPLDRLSTDILGPLPETLEVTSIF